MAATDITTVVTESPGTREFEIPERMVAYDIDFTNPDFVGIETVATHKLVTIPIGDALVRGLGVVTTAVLSGGAATLKFNINGDDITGLIPKANLAIGDVFDLVLNNGTGTQSGSGYAHTTALTLDLIVGTSAITAGVVRLYVVTIDNIT